MLSLKAARPGIVSATTGLLLTFPLSLPCGSAYAQAAARAEQHIPASTGLAIKGRVANPRSYSLADLRRLEPATVRVSQMTDQGSRSASFSGVLLRTLLDRAGLIDEPGRKTRLRHVLLASGSDGYAVAIALGEVDPAFEDKPIIVAYAQDGKPLTGLRLVVPGDRHAGRSVRDLVSLDVR